MKVAAHSLAACRAHIVQVCMCACVSAALGGANVLGETRQLCYMAFDILMLDDKAVIEKPLHERRGQTNREENSWSCGLHMWRLRVGSRVLQCSSMRLCGQSRSNLK
jgi:hypothetical protein